MTAVVPRRQPPDAAADDVAANDVPVAAPVVELLTPREGVPPVVVSAEQLADAQARLAAGTGPVAVDAERASGYRYSQRAYLVQLRRAGTGTLLVDPIACPDLTGLSQAVEGAEWVLHAASQDLACLAEVGMVPSLLFDTELAGRLAGFERVGLDSMVERVLGFRLRKEHSAADWSTRPLPESWLRYAALDVELLVELRDALAAELDAQGKLGWAREEFAALADAPPREPRSEPWRRTSGIHRLRHRRQLAGVRSLWTTRDQIARRRDIASHRVLPDSAIVGAVLAAPRDADALAALPVFSGPRMRRQVGTWFAALAEAAALPERSLPLTTGAGSGAGDALPPTNRWSERDPSAAARLARAREALAVVSAERAVPVENLLEPALVRRMAWSPPAEPSPAAAGADLRSGGARPWQVALTAEVLAAALAEPPPVDERVSTPGDVASAHALPAGATTTPAPGVGTSPGGAGHVEGPAAPPVPAGG